MSASIIVQGVINDEKRWKAIRDVFKACKSANSDLPKPIAEILGVSEKFEQYSDSDRFDEIENRRGIYTDLYGTPAYQCEDDDCEKGDDYCSGIFIHLDKLPKEIKMLRIYMD